MTDNKKLLRGYLIKTKAKIYPVRAQTFGEALRIANGIAWREGLDLGNVDEIDVVMVTNGGNRK